MVETACILIVLSDFRGDSFQGIHFSQIGRETELPDGQCRDDGPVYPDPLAKLVMEKRLSELDDIYDRRDIDPVDFSGVAGQDNAVSMAKHHRPSR